jgi:hypothetical protein
VTSRHLRRSHVLARYLDELARANDAKEEILGDSWNRTFASAASATVETESHSNVLTRDYAEASLAYLE